MSIISGYVTVKLKNNEKLKQYFSPVYGTKVPVTLAENFVYRLSIDQSTSCTGLFIRSECGTINLMLEVKRGASEKEEYFKELEYILKQLFLDQKVSIIIHEEPVPNKNQYYSGKVLIELKGRLREWIKRIPAFQDAEVVSMYPQSWKTFVVDKEAAKESGKTAAQRAKSKASIAEDVCKFLPDFYEYRMKHFSTDYDGFDAAGIMIGFRLAAFKPNGKRRIYGMKEKRHTSYVFYKYVPLKELQEAVIPQDVILGDLTYGEHPKYLAYNENYKFVDNVIMATSSDKMTLTALPESELNRLQWMFDFELDKSKVMIAVLVNKSKYTAGQIEAFKYILPWYEEIKGA